MSDYDEYQDDLDILTSLLDDEDDEENKLRKRVKSKTPSASAVEKRYTNNPGTSKKAEPTEGKDASHESTKAASAKYSSVEPEESIKEEYTHNVQEDMLEFDDDEDIDDLAALLDAEKAEELSSEQGADQPNAASSSAPSTSHDGNRPPSESAKVKTEDDADDDTTTSPGKRDEEKSKDELLEELLRLKDQMAKTKDTKSGTENQISLKKETAQKSPPREMFSEAISPKLETNRPKPSKGSASQQSRKDAKKQTSPGSTSGSPGDGNQQKKKKYTMDAAAATALFHDSQSDDDQEMESESSDSEEETLLEQVLNKSRSPSSSETDLFTKQKKRVAHTPNNQQIKPKKESPYQCRQCDQTFRDSHTFQVHQYKHRANPSNKCTLCSKNFSSRSQLTAHLRTHGQSGEKELLKLTQTTKIHMANAETPSSERKKENPPQNCTLCGEEFTRRSQLHAHLRSHGESGNRVLKKMTTTALPSDTSTSTPSTSRHKTDYASTSALNKSDYASVGNSSTSRRKPGSKLLGDQRKMKDEATGQLYETERYSQIRIVNPVISSTSMAEKMQGRKFIRFPLISKHIDRASGDVQGDWATMAVIVSKIPPKTSSKGKAFSIWKLNDLHRLDQTVSFFLFGKVHEEHWKTVEGSVVGILNANIMPNRDHGQPDELAMTIDHPQKMLVMGKSKDFGFCKGKKKKNGNPCTSVVNKSACEYCEFHVQNEYKKVSSKRTDLQATYSGCVPKKFAGQSVGVKGQFFHGGKSYNLDPSKNIKASVQKKKSTTGTSLGSARGVDQMLSQVRKDVVMMHGKGKNEEDTMVHLSGASANFKDLLSKPSPGTQNLMRHMVTAESKCKPKTQGLSAVELISKQKKEEKLKHSLRKASSTKSQAPSFGRSQSPMPGKSQGPMLGSYMDDEDEFWTKNMAMQMGKKQRTSSGSNNRMAEIAKRKAQALIKNKGPLTKQDPNCVGRNKELSERKKEALRKRVERDLMERNGAESSPENKEEKEPVRKKRKLYLDDDEEMSKEQMTAIINAKSINAEQLAELEADWQDKYFTELEKKEKLETKMSEVMQRKCKVVSCKQCKYTWFAPSSLCVKQKHVLSRHDATERFFVCNGCRVRTVAFEKIPTRPCRCCGSTNFERVSMLKERKGPKLESEKLLIRGEERKHVSSL